MTQEAKNQIPKVKLSYVNRNVERHVRRNVYSEWVDD